MRKVNMLLLAAVLMLALGQVRADAAGAARSEAPAGFRDIAWGTPVADVPGLVPVAGPEYGETYYRNREKLVFGGVKVRSIAYYFRDGHFYGYGIVIEGEPEHFKLRQYLEGRFGPGRQIGNKHGWTWDSVSAVLTHERSDLSTFQVVNER